MRDYPLLGSGGNHPCPKDTGEGGYVCHRHPCSQKIQWEVISRQPDKLKEVIGEGWWKYDGYRRATQCQNWGEVRQSPSKNVERLVEFQQMWYERSSRIEMAKRCTELSSQKIQPSHSARQWVGPTAHMFKKMDIEILFGVNFIEPEISEWASLIVFAPKNRRSLHFFTDYRKLNAVIFKKAYPVSHIHKCLRSLVKDVHCWPYTPMMGTTKSSLRSRARTKLHFHRVMKFTDFYFCWVWETHRAHSNEWWTVFRQETSGTSSLYIWTMSLFTGGLWNNNWTRKTLYWSTFEKRALSPSTVWTRSVRFYTLCLKILVGEWFSGRNERLDVLFIAMCHLRGQVTVMKIGDVTSSDLAEEEGRGAGESGSEEVVTTMDAATEAPVVARALIKYQPFMRCWWQGLRRHGRACHLGSSNYDLTGLAGEDKRSCDLSFDLGCLWGSMSRLYSWMLNRQNLGLVKILWEWCPSCVCSSKSLLRPLVCCTRLSFRPGWCTLIVSPFGRQCCSLR